MLGQELRKHIDCYAPTRKELNIVPNSHNYAGNCYEESRYKDLWDKDTHPEFIWFKYRLKEMDCKLIVHVAAFTDLVRAEKEKQLCYETNVLGTRYMALLGIPMLYISTEYVFDGTKGNYEEKDYPNPQNFYALAKLLGEYESRRTRSVVVRCLFKPRPFKHDAVCVDMFTSGDYVDCIAREIVLAIKKFNELPPTLHIGTGRKSLASLARQTKQVKEIRRDDVTGVRLPLDTSLNCSLWESIKSDHPRIN